MPLFLGLLAASKISALVLQHELHRAPAVHSQKAHSHLLQGRTAECGATHVPQPCESTVPFQYFRIQVCSAPRMDFSSEQTEIHIPVGSLSGPVMHHLVSPCDRRDRMELRGGSGKGEPELEPSHQPEQSKAGAQKSSFVRGNRLPVPAPYVAAKERSKESSLAGHKFPLASKSCLSPSMALKRHQKAKPQPSRAIIAPKPGQFQMPPANLSKEGLKMN